MVRALPLLPPLLSYRYCCAAAMLTAVQLLGCWCWIGAAAAPAAAVIALLLLVLLYE
jgi:hypothetical protein